MPLAEKLSSYFDLTMHLENEANLSALGENSFSVHADNLISIRIGSGIGAGVIIDRQLVKGRNGYSGRLGILSLFQTEKSVLAEITAALNSMLRKRVSFMSIVKLKEDLPRLMN